MSSRIQPLAADVANLIAAGEVIDSWAAVVRELVENALDAGCDRIQIKLFPLTWEIQVIDNGSGMTLEDLRRCVAPRTTSKISSSDDLSQVTTLGFRGEALHSLSQLSQLKIASCPRNPDADAWELTYRNGDVLTENQTAIAPGTIVTVSELFGNRPRRRQCLPPSDRQLKSVQRYLQRVALCHPHVTWQLWQDEKPVYKISPAPTARETLCQILRNLQPNDLLVWQDSIDDLDDDSDSSAELVLGLPDRCHRRRPDWVKVALNGRIIQAPDLEQVIISGLHRTLPRDRYPVCFLHLHLPPVHIDWNRHPAKTEIYLRDPEHWQRQIRELLQQALNLSPVHLPQTTTNERVHQILKVAEKTSTYQLSDRLPGPSGLQTLTLTAIAQVRKTYIVAEHPGGLWLIEQHIAHERVLFEQIREDWQIEALEKPLTLKNLTPRSLENLRKLGMPLEPFGENFWLTRVLPKLLHQRSDAVDALHEISRSGDLQTAQVAIACRSAIRNGTTLTKAAMQDLLNRWQRTANPHTCPHGRPIYLSLEETALARFFRRHWVIGKSHGI
ncbi:MAG: DNA mismatch repair endonuclease MutL [Cyanobacteria bacterium P01_H01_bin.15]